MRTLLDNVAPMNSPVSALRQKQASRGSLPLEPWPTLSSLQFCGSAAGAIMGLPSTWINMQPRIRMNYALQI
jgi:hypothetical protein